jgi:hypothetical protein
VVLYIGIAVGWCLLAFVAFAICRAASLTEDAQTRELADWIASGGPRGDGRPITDDDAAPALADQTRASRATG